MPDIIILGTGMAGFGAAHRLTENGLNPTMYDKNTYHGGHTASFRYDGGFLFDLGPHISFTKDLRIQELFAESVDHEYETMQIKLNNYWRGYWPTHPVQVNLFGLPSEIVAKVIVDFVDIRQAPEQPAKNYAEWLLASFGRTFAELFPMQYTRKYHTTSADNMSTDWLGPRIYRPSLEEVIKGAISPSSPAVHYITHFRYPRYGGFVSYLRKFLPMGNLQLGRQVQAIDPHIREITFSDGAVARYDGLISSIPLPDLVPMIKGVPQDVLDSVRRLACSSCMLVNIGVDRQDLSGSQLTYFYDEDISFARLSFPHMFSGSNAPPGKGSIQAEVYFSKKYRPFTGAPNICVDRVIADLRRCGTLRPEDTICFTRATYLPYANVIFDLDRAEALKTVHGYLDDHSIAYCGRYGDWGYMWTDESFKSGENAAQKVLDQSWSSKASPRSLRIPPKP